MILTIRPLPDRVAVFEAIDLIRGRYQLMNIILIIAMKIVQAYNPSLTEKIFYKNSKNQTVGRVCLKVFKNPDLCFAFERYPLSYSNIYSLSYSNRKTYSNRASR
jgi:hypothetical protein